MAPFGASRAGLMSTRVDAIPDSEADQKLAHRYVLDDINNTISDSVGEVDGEVNGVSSTSGDWSGGEAGESDGVDDHISFAPEWDIFESPTDIAIALSVKTTDNGYRLIEGQEDAGTNEDWIQFGSGIIGDDGGLDMLIRNRGEDEDARITTGSNLINDGDPYRIVFNVPSGNTDDWEIWKNQTDQPITIVRSANIPDQSLTIGLVAAFAGIDSDGVRKHYEGVIDDICIYHTSLTESEIQSYSNPWD